MRKQKLSTKLICLFLLFAAVITAFVAIAYTDYMYGNISKIDNSCNYEEQLFLNAKATFENPNVVLDPVHKLDSIELDYSPDDGEPFYRVSVSGMDTPQGFLIGDFYGDESRVINISENTHIVQFSKRHELMIQSAREHVIKYIRDSSVLENKDLLIREIENVPFYLYSESDQDFAKIPNAPATYGGGAVYCCQKYDELFCEWIFVHELFHHLRYLTSGGFSSERYYAMVLDETIVDLLTAATNPKGLDSSEWGNGYTIYHEPVNKYLYTLGEDALYAFFYGYSNWFSSNSTTFQAEHDTFALVLQYYDTSIESVVCTETILKHWSSQME